MSFQSIVLFILAGCAIVVCFQNIHTANVKIFWWQAEIPVIVLIFIVLIIGFNAGYILGALKQNKHHRNAIDKL